MLICAAHTESATDLEQLYEVVLLYIYSINIWTNLITLSAANQCVAVCAHPKSASEMFCLSMHVKYFITVMSYQDLHVCVRLCFTLDHSSGLKLYFFSRRDLKWLAGVPKRLVRRE